MPMNRTRRNSRKRIKSDVLSLVMREMGINRVLKKSNNAINMLAERSRGELLIRHLAPFNAL